MKTVRLRFTTNSKSWVSWAIRSICWSKYSHVELLIPGKGFLGAHFPSGVRIRDFNYDPGCNFQFADVQVPDDVYGRVFEFAYEQIDKPYDWGACLGIAFHRDWHNPCSWECAELVAGMFEAASYPILNPEKPLNRVTPGHIYDSPLLEFHLPGIIPESKPYLRAMQKLLHFTKGGKL